MYLNEDQLMTFREQGVLPLGRVLSEEEVEAGRAHLQTLINSEHVAVSGEDGRHLRVMRPSQLDAWFRDLLHHPGVLDATESVLGPNVQYHLDQIHYKPAREGGSGPWHHDNAYWRSDPPEMLTIWIALDDATLETGVLKYVAGSHHSLIEPRQDADSEDTNYNLDEEQFDTSKVVSWTVPAGHAVMHHCLTVHGTGPNRGDRERGAVTIHLARAQARSGDFERYPLLRWKYRE